MIVDKRLKIEAFENDLQDFTSGGLDILKFVYRKRHENPDMKLNFYDNSGEYYICPEHFSIGDDLVFKKKQHAGEIPAEVILSYAYNLIGFPSPVAYPYFMSTYKMSSKGITIPDGIITKDIRQVFPTAEHRFDDDCHTFQTLYNSDKCENITREGKLAKVKETIASVAFNNKDAGYYNTFWVKDPKLDKYTSIVSIDHGYSGRDSMYASTKEGLLLTLYYRGEHGYNGMYKMEEDRRTVIYYLKKLLAGNSIDGVQLTDQEIIEINNLIELIGKLDFKEISSDFKDRYKYNCSPKFIQSLEWSREDLCKELS